MVRVDQERLELGAAPFVAAGGEGAEGVAVVALPPGDDMASGGLALFDEVLAGHLEGRLHRLGAAAHEVGVRNAGRGAANEVIGETLGNLGREEPRVGVGEAVDLGMDCGHHVGMTMAEAGHGRAAGGVEIDATGSVDELDPAAGHGDGQGAGDLAMKEMGHGGGVVGRVRPGRGRGGVRPWGSSERGRRRAAPRCV